MFGIARKSKVISRFEPMKTRYPLLTLAASTVAMSSLPASAGTWRSSATAGANWTDANNWVGAVAPVEGEVLTFSTPVTGGTRTVNNDFAANTNFGISLNANLFVLGGNAVDLTSNFNTSYAGSGSLGTVNLILNLQQDTQFNIGGASSRLDVNGDISGSFGLEKTGVGTVRLQTGTKTYTGNTVVTAGTLDLNVANALPSGAGKGNVKVDASMGLRFGQTINGLNGSSTGTISAFSSGTKGLSIGSNDANGDFAGTISKGSGVISVTKVGSGTQTLSGTNSYTGATTVSAGSLYVNGALGATAVTANGGIFGGTGTVGGNVTINAATFAAGASPGSIEIGGNVNLAGTSTTAIELGGTTFTLNGTEQYDRTKLTGAAASLTLGGGVLSLSLVDGFTLAANQVFGIFQLESGASRSGTFSGLLNDGDLVGNFGGTDLFISYSGNFSDSGTVQNSGGNDIVLYTVPEPGTAGIGAIGMLALLRRRRA